MSDTNLADQIPGAPHPRETKHLFGQDAARDEFLAALAQGRLHHGWLITGPRGIGKATLAWKIAGFLLSTNPHQEAGLFGAPVAPTSLDLPEDHPDARLIAAGAHPRLSVLRRTRHEKTGNLSDVIRVEDVRKLKQFFGLSAADGGRRVVIIDAADEMNVSAANAILKLLEEPPADAILLLISHQPSRLLPTIRSRCRELRLNTLPPDDLSQAIAAAGIETHQGEALSALAEGSVGEAIRLTNLDGLALYSDLIKLFDGVPQIERPIAIKLAESCTGKTNVGRLDLMLDLLDRFLARLARAGLLGAPEVQAASGEKLLLTRLSPHDNAARKWATLSQEISARGRHGRAVNLDPASLILDMLLRVEQTANDIAAT